MINFLSVFNPVVNAVSGYFADKRKLKQSRVDSDIKINEAKTVGIIKRLATGQNSDIAWEQLSIQNNGWKDEFLTIVISTPIILCFIPFTAPYVKEGFVVLSTVVPDWFLWSWGVVVSSAFGYRKLASFMSLKKGV